MNRFTSLMLVFIGMMAGAIAPMCFGQSTSFVSEQGIAYDLQG